MSILSDWNYYIGGVAFIDLLLSGFPSWETENEMPTEIRLDFVMGEGKQSIDIAREWDDVAKYGFYWEDAPDRYPGPILKEGDGYTSRFFFQRKSEAERFEVWINTNSG